MRYEIRNASAADEAAWRELWSGYCEFYQVQVAPTISNATWARIIANPARVGCRLLVSDGVVMGFAHHVLHEGTWVDKPIAYLEDLFVRPEGRGRKLGKALIDDLLALAKTNGWSRVYWHTNRDNATARKLYDHYTVADNFVRYRLNLNSD
jgi:GNAT superfamily N-acetyltransferase